MLKLIAKLILRNELKEKDNEISNLKSQLATIQISLEDYLNKKGITYPKSYGQITWQEELKLLNPICNTVNITDEFLQLTTVDEAKAFSAETKVQFKKWIKEDYDCDNFSASLYGYWSDALKSFAFGIARSPNHQFNIFIDKDKKVWIVEPQTNKYMTIEEAKKASSPDKLSYFPITLIWM